MAGSNDYYRIYISPTANGGIGSTTIVGIQTQGPLYGVYIDQDVITRNLSAGIASCNTLDVSNTINGNLDGNVTGNVTGNISGTTGSFGGDVSATNVSASSSVTAEGLYGETGTFSGLVSAGEFSANSKAFNIPHPSPNKEGIRLWHGCLEGPEHGVYVRGRITNQKEINLPAYWKDLVNVRTMTVSLTPVGSHQNVIVKRFDAEKIYLQAQGGTPIDCFYHIYGERKDIDPLIIEQEEVDTDP